MRTGIILGTAAGTAEAVLVVGRVARRFESPDTLPLAFCLGAGGRIVVTHFLFWIIASLLVSAAPALWMARRRRRSRPVRAAQSVFVPVFVLLVAGVVIPPDLYLQRLLRPQYVIAAMSGAVLLATAACLAVLWAHHRRRPGTFQSVWRLGPWVCVGVAVPSAICMYASPFRGAGFFRLDNRPVALPVEAAGGPNFLWIVLDTVRADHLGCYGYARPTSPFLDAWATRAVVYDRVVSNSFWTVPAHASMFTGLAVRRHGATHENAWLADEHRTIAELLSEQGYVTAIFSNNPHVSAGRNFTQGFDHAPPVYEFSWLERMSLDTWQRWLGLTPAVPWLEWDLGAAATNAYIARFLDDRLAEGAEGRRPWFIFVNYMEAHLPYASTYDFRRKFMSSREARRSYALLYRAYGDIISWLSLQFNMLGPEYVCESDQRVLAGSYDAALAYLDARVEQLIRLFERRGLLENTVVIITSDHGESLGEHGQWGHHFGVNDTLVRVPVLIRYPGMSDGRRVSHAVQLSDLFPTVAALAGRPVPPFSIHDAHDLNDLGELAVQERIAVAECLVPDLFPLIWAQAIDPNYQVGRFRRRLQAVVKDEHKYVHASDGRHELFHLPSDPAELHNVIEDEPGIAGRLRARLRTWEQDLPEYRVPADQKKPDLPPHMTQRLRALGYLQ